MATLQPYGIHADGTPVQPWEYLAANPGASAPVINPADYPAGASFSAEPPAPAVPAHIDYGIGPDGKKLNLWDVLA